jgi:lipopolysaccharide export LptBFGC system permease protein LptF
MSVANRTWLVSRSGAIYHYGLYDQTRDALYGLSVYEFDPAGDRLTRLTTTDRTVYTETGWVAGKGWARRYRGPGTKLEAETERFETRRLSIEPPDYFETELIGADMMTFSELRRHIEELRTSGFNIVPSLVQLQRKVAFPFVTLVMTLLAVPFAITTGRRGTLYGIGVGIVLSLTYWLLTSVFAAIGTAGLLAPALAAWAPNIIFGTGAIYLILTVRT